MTLKISCHKFHRRLYFAAVWYWTYMTLVHSRPIHEHHQHKPEADMCHLISSYPGLPEPSLQHTIKQIWKAMAIEHLVFKTIFIGIILDFKLTPCLECCMLSAGQFRRGRITQKKVCNNRKHVRQMLAYQNPAIRFIQTHFYQPLPFQGNTKLNDSIIQDLVSNWLISLIDVYKKLMHASLNVIFSEVFEECRIYY